MIRHPIARKTLITKTNNSLNMFFTVSLPFIFFTDCFPYGEWEVHPPYLMTSGPLTAPTTYDAIHVQSFSACISHRTKEQRPVMTSADSGIPPVVFSEKKEP